MKLSLALVSIGLCATSALAQSIATVTFHTAEDTWDENPESGVCIASQDPTTPVTEIDIEGDVKCTFYTEDDCKGQSYSLKEGPHTFKRDFYVTSFSCV